MPNEPMHLTTMPAALLPQILRPQDLRQKQVVAGDRGRQKMKRLVAITFLALPLACFAQETDRMATLAETVAAANQSLQSHNYSNTVRRLFALTNEEEVASATIHLQRPKCLAMYEQLFAQLVSIKPRLDTLSTNTAMFSCPTPILVGTNSWDRFDNMEVMFIFDGSQWIFHDPSFERKLGRRTTSKE